MIHMLCDDFGHRRVKTKKKSRRVELSNCLWLSRSVQVLINLLSIVTGRHLILLPLDAFFSIRCLRKCLSLHLWRYSYRLSRKTYDMTYVKRHARKSWFYRPKNFERSDDRWSSMTFQSDTRDTLITRKDLDMTTSHESIFYWRPWMRSSIYFTSESLNNHSFYSNSSWRETLLPSYRSADNSFLIFTIYLLWRSCIGMFWKLRSTDDMIWRTRCGNVIRKLGDISSWQDASCHLSDVVKGMKNDVPLFKFTFSQFVNWRPVSFIMIWQFLNSFEIYIEKTSHMRDAAWTNVLWISSSRHKSPLHQYIINAIRGYERTIHNFG